MCDFKEIFEEERVGETYSMTKEETLVICLEDLKTGEILRFDFLDSFYVDDKEILAVVDAKEGGHIEFIDNSNPDEVVFTNDEEVFEVFGKLHENDEKYEIIEFLEVEYEETGFDEESEIDYLPILKRLKVVEGEEIIAVESYIDQEGKSAVDFVKKDTSGNMIFVDDEAEYNKLYDILLESC